MKAVGIDAELDVADVGRFTVMATNGWKGILMPGYPTPSNIVYMINRFGAPNYYTSMYRPAGWQDKWDAVVAQTDDAIRIDQIQQLIKTMADEAITIPIYETHSPFAHNGKVHDIGWVTKC